MSNPIAMLGSRHVRTSNLTLKELDAVSVVEKTRHGVKVWKATGVSSTPVNQV